LKEIRRYFALFEREALLDELLPNLIVSHPTHPVQQPMANAGGVPYAPETRRDPFETWMELMEVVEMLCPRWPERDLVISKHYRL
jgi:hypothetical protein